MFGRTSLQTIANGDVVRLDIDVDPVAPIRTINLQPFFACVGASTSSLIEVPLSCMVSITCVRQAGNYGPVRFIFRVAAGQFNVPMTQAFRTGFTSCMSISFNVIGARSQAVDGLVDDIVTT